MSYVVRIVDIDLGMQMLRLGVLINAVPRLLERGNMAYGIP